MTTAKMAPFKMEKGVKSRDAAKTKLDENQTSIKFCQN